MKASVTGSGLNGTTESEREDRLLVWILDDSDLEAAMARRALASTYDLELFVDGSAMLERIASGTIPHVLVLDWQLPGLSGIEVCRFLRSTRDEMDLPILMLTVYGHQTDLVDGLAAGANDYLTKPYDAPELAARVATLARVNMLYRKVRCAEQKAVELRERERLWRQDAEAANRSKDEFLATVSHELRTPLNAILGWTRLVRSGSLRPEQVDGALSTVERNAMAQTRLIEDLLDVSRIVSGNLTMEPEPLDLVNVVKTSIDAVRPTAESCGVLLELRVQSGAGLIVGDPHRLGQVIWNLLTNAIKFTAKGGRVTLGCDSVDSSIQISVKDTGRGIDPAFLPHVFERFRQGNVGPGRSHGGLGIGLAIAKHIVELHGGVIEARSDGVDQGATFLVRLPRVTGMSHSDRPVAGQPEAIAGLVSSRKLAGLRILVVDDDLDALELIGTMLRQNGADIVSAGSAATALEAFESTRPDILVSDVGMPFVDGHELMRRLRALSPDAGGRTPALALTAFAGVEDRTRALSAGFNMYVAKPIDPKELIVSVANLAGRFDTGG